MGRDKAMLPFGDETLLQRVLRIVSPLVAEVLVVAHTDQTLPALPEHVRVVYDEVEDQGPLAGLQAGLRQASAEALFATGCDVPFLQPTLIELLFERLGDARIAVADEAGFAHPLAAVYRREVLVVVERLLAEGRRRPLFLYDEVATVRVGEDDLRRVDPELLSLANLNTPEAYEAALARLAAEQDA
jgi:molybdopterin-guanine dinucleotide biosynthesis protein A